MNCPPPPVFLFFRPIVETLEDRLRKRSEDAEEVIQRRLGTATREIEDYDKYNYVLVNDDLQDSVQRLQAIVRSERIRCANREGAKNQNSNGAEDPRREIGRRQQDHRASGAVPSGEHSRSRAADSGIVCFAGHGGLLVFAIFIIEAAGSGRLTHRIIEAGQT